MSRHSSRVLFVLCASLLIVAHSESQMRRGKFGIGLGTSTYLLQSDFKSSDLSFGGSVDMSYSVLEHVGLRSSLGGGLLSSKNNLGASVKTDLLFGKLYVSGDLMPHDRFNPYGLLGVGLIYFVPRTSDGRVLVGRGDVLWDVNLLMGVGFDYFIDEFWALNFRIVGALTNTDGLDGLGFGSNKDSYQRITIGVRYHLFDENFVKKMIEAYENRAK